MRYGVVVEELASEVMAELPTAAARREVLELVELVHGRRGVRLRKIALSQLVADTAGTPAWMLPPQLADRRLNGGRQPTRAGLPTQ